MNFPIENQINDPLKKLFSSIEFHCLWVLFFFSSFFFFFFFFFLFVGVGGGSNKMTGEESWIQFFEPQRKIRDRG